MPTAYASSTSDSSSRGPKVDTSTSGKNASASVKSSDGKRTTWFQTSRGTGKDEKDDSKKQKADDDGEKQEGKTWTSTGEEDGGGIWSFLVGGTKDSDAPAKASVGSGDAVKAKAGNGGAAASSGNARAEAGDAKAESDGAAASTGDGKSAAMTK